MYSANKNLYEGVAYNATDLHPVAPMKVHLLVAHAITIKSLVVSVNMDECRQLHQSHGIVGKDPVVDRMLKLSSRPWLWLRRKVAKGCSFLLGSSLKHDDDEINDGYHVSLWCIMMIVLGDGKEEDNNDNKDNEYIGL